MEWEMGVTIERCGYGWIIVLLERRNIQNKMTAFSE